MKIMALSFKDGWDYIPHQLQENGDLTFYDYPELYNMEVGDRIHYSTGLGVGHFDVVAVVPANLKDYPERMTYVVARPKT